jgi:two-component system chemotaxis response regulator CheB
MTMEVEMADLDAETMHEPDRPGVPAGFGCPNCAGALFQIDEGGLRRYRCRVGHAWSPESLLAEQTVAMESALWMALRSLEEKAALNTDLGQRAAAEGHDLTAHRFEENARETLHAAELVRRLIDELGSPVPETDVS